MVEDSSTPDDFVILSLGFCSLFDPLHHFVTSFIVGTFLIEAVLFHNFLGAMIQQLDFFVLGRLKALTYE